MTSYFLSVNLGNSKKISYIFLLIIIIIRRKIYFYVENSRQIGKGSMGETAIFIDIHAHVLPGVDDGARTMEEACELLKKSFEQGARAVIATPHYSRRRGADGLYELAEALQNNIREILPEFHIYLGQELYYHEALVEHLKAGTALTLAGSRYALVEFEPMTPYETVFRGIRKLCQAGYIPVLAHMERYICLRTERNLVDLEGSGCIFQMNYESLDGNLFRKDVRWCRKQVMLGRIQLLGTDMHRLDFRPPETSRARKWLTSHVSSEMLERMMYCNPIHIINDEKIN